MPRTKSLPCKGRCPEGAEGFRLPFLKAIKNVQYGQNSKEKHKKLIFPEGKVK